MSTISSTASAPSPSRFPPPVSPRSTVNPPEFRSQHSSSPSPSPTTEPIYVTERRAFVDCEPYPPLPVRLAFQFLPESSVASFRLRVSVVLNVLNIESPQAVPPRNKKKNSGHIAKKRKRTRHAQQTQTTQPEQTTLYVSINPEDILSITYETPLSSSSSSSVAKAGISSVRALPAAISAAWSSSFTTGQDALCVRFTLARPPQLIAPTSRVSSDGQSLRANPAGQTDSEVLTAWRSLSGRLGFSLYTTADLLTTSQLAILCSAASTPGLLKSSARHHDLSSLYGGRSGAVVYAEVVEKNHTSPPSYDELALSPPPPAHQGHKSHQSLLSSPSRQLLHRDGQSRSPGSILSATTPMRRDKGKQQQQQDKVDDASPVPLVSVKAEMTALLLSQFSELEARLTEKLDRRLDHHHPPELWTAAMAERLSELQDTMTQYVDEQVDLLRQEIWESLEDRWDDHRLSTRADLDDYIDEKIQDAQEEIKDQLQNTGVTLLFND
ncbi:hypothetical protein LA080_011742 [Diaporthe eres]|nr:hypothetical protein LA080_011742 [Diaporthe eres]